MWHKIGWKPSQGPPRATHRPEAEHGEDGRSEPLTRLETVKLGMGFQVDLSEAKGHPEPLPAGEAGGV